MAKSDEAPPRVSEDKPGAENQPPVEGRYRLLTTHVIEGKALPPGTEVGAGTDIPYAATPSNQMEGLDEVGVREVNELHQKLYGRPAPWHDANSPLVAARADAEEAAKQQEEAAKSEPVSHQQAWERGHDKYRDQPVMPPQARSVPATPAAHPVAAQMGPATADVSIDNPDVQPRTSRPLVDQQPPGSASGPKE